MIVPLNPIGVQNNVACFFKFVSEEEKIAYYATSDVYFFPSIYEPFGIVSLEAMSIAKTVVVGAQEIVGFR